VLASALPTLSFVYRQKKDNINKISEFGVRRVRFESKSVDPLGSAAIRAVAPPHSHNVPGF
jgi:hypothetical protein